MERNRDIRELLFFFFFFFFSWRRIVGSWRRVPFSYQRFRPIFTP